MWGFNPGCVPDYVWKQSEKWKRARNWLHNLTKCSPLPGQTTTGRRLKRALSQWPSGVSP